MANRSDRSGFRSLSSSKSPLLSRFQLESLGLFATACLFIAASHLGGWFKSLDRLIYDSVVSQVNAPQSPELVMVAIDDATLHEFGPWPWPRTLQGQLLDAINQYEPKSILLDIVYSGEKSDNSALTAAAQRVDLLALPMMIDAVAHGQQHIEVLPYPDLLDHADILGHVQIERDDDAIVRGTYLYEGVGTPHWPHVMLALAEQVFDYHPEPCELKAPASSSPLLVQKCNYVQIPFAGPPGTYPQVSASHLLNQDLVSSQSLQQALGNKLVLVGITATGGSDWVTSPLGTQSTPLSGVEFNANLLSALLADSIIQISPDWLVILIGIGLTGWCALSLPRLRPKQALVTSIGLAVLPILGSAGLLAYFWVSIPLANVTIATLLIYPLWSWRRHEIAWSFVESELDRLVDEENKWQQHRGKSDGSSPHQALQQLLNSHITLPTSETGAVQVHRENPLSEVEQAVLNHHLANLSPQLSMDVLPGERLAAQISSLEKRAQQLRQSRDIGLAGLDRMSNGAIIISDLGEVRFINQAAERMLAWEESRPLLQQLDSITTPLGLNWQDIWRATVLDRRTITFESSLEDHPIFVTAAPLDHDQDLGFAPSWVLTISDLSEVREAQAQREEALAFLSHDIRSPLASILALLQQSDSTSAQDSLMERITGYAKKGLATSDQFLQLSRLQLHPSFETYSLELEQLLHNSIEQVYFLAKEKHVTFVFEESGNEEGVWFEGNGELLERTFVNLLGNAVKYSPENTTTTISVQLKPEQAVIQISDQGHGIPANEIKYIFEPFFRSDEVLLAQNRGAGLGLRFVKTVVERHRGDISVVSTWGVGTTFRIRLPLER